MPILSHWPPVCKGTSYRSGPHIREEQSLDAPASGYISHTVLLPALARPLLPQQVISASDQRSSDLDLMGADRLPAHFAPSYRVWLLVCRHSDAVRAELCRRHLELGSRDPSHLQGFLNS